ncbi:MAG: gamma-glutamyltransferase [Acidimicrobiia bacterium]|nr:gamma-glutamyltransferase [Acidimicrobiia bacterium]
MPRIAIAAPSPFCARLGADIAEQGGSAVDILVGVSLAATVSEPGVCCPGAGGFLTIGGPGVNPVTIDGYLAVPGLGHPDSASRTSHRVTMEYGAGTITEVGAGSVAVPGSIAAFHSAWSRWGRMPWEDLLIHVADAVDSGFPMSSAADRYLAAGGDLIYTRDQRVADVLFPGGVQLRTGESVVIPGLGASLRQIGVEGPATLYGGELGRMVVDGLASDGGIMTLRDLADYQAQDRPSLTGRFLGWEFATNPPPAIGGVTLTAILEHIEGSPLDPNSWVRAQELVFGLRRRLLDNSADRVDGAARLLAASRSASTVATAVASDDGWVAAATMSAGYGSGVSPGETGMWMNNSLGELELNRRSQDEWTAGERLPSNMAPTVLRSGNGRRVAISSPGADRITSAIAITIALLVAGDGDLVLAVEHPRVHLQFDESGSMVAVEHGLEVETDLEVRHHEPHDMYFGGVVAAAIDPVEAHADSRRAGGVLIIEV